MEEVKTHCCRMKNIGFPRSYNRLGFFDIETFEQGEGCILKDMLLHFVYESRVDGVFNEVTFTHSEFEYEKANKIERNAYTFDYLPNTIPNEFDANGLIKPVKINKKEPSPHQNFVTSSDETEVLADQEAYNQTLLKYKNIVDEEIQKRPVFRFLCFILNERHKNRVILSHFGSRFDSLIVAEVLLSMRHVPDCLAQGQGMLELNIPEWQITILDSYRYWPQKLATLPRRFQLEESKGYFSHTFNRPEHWNRVRDMPPPLEEYLSKQDSTKEKE